MKCYVGVIDALLVPVTKCNTLTLLQITLIDYLCL